MKVAAVVILYHPEERVKENILSYSGFIDKIFILDNTRNPDFHFNFSDSKFLYLADHQNKGISERLNQAAELAIHAGFNWLLTMDQDSAFEEKNIKQYLNCLENFSDRENVSMFGVNYSGIISEESNCTFIESLQLITSGSILNLKIWKKLNGFDEQLFIDEVDFEYCLRSKKTGFKTIQFPAISIIHNLGKLVKGRSLKNAKITARTIHAPKRIYYISRNFFYLQKKYRQDFPKELKERKKSLFIRLKNNLIYNPQKIKVVQYFLRSLVDFRKNKMGKQY